MHTHMFYIRNLSIGTEVIPGISSPIDDPLSKCRTRRNGRIDLTPSRGTVLDEKGGSGTPTAASQRTRALNSGRSPAA